ncbi:MAG: glucose-1-phosphate adenylyltransferase [Gemmatimonadales bacterium]|nr:glucose-1-phosphate adenylyltransferase [Gemmatimonadales bacterium]
MNTLQQVRNTMTMILAGGQGERLYPLTRDRSKPSVPFGSAYRIIDFTLSNCINSGLRQIYVLTQYKSYSLDKHLQRGWNIFSYEGGEFLYRIPPQQRVGQKWYEGTADAVYQNIYLLENRRPEHVLLLSGDHIYKMDYTNLIRFHHDQGGQLSLCAAVVPKAGAHEFGILEVNDQWKVIGFEEKPADPRTIPGDPEHCLVNMGVYLFNTDSLVRELSQDAREANSNHDFGRNIIPSLVKEGQVYAYPFRDQDTNEPSYWRDIGTLDSYYDATMDLVSRRPKFDMYDENWLFRAWQPPVPPCKSVHGFTKDGTLPGILEDSIVGGGSIISGGHVERSILGRRVRVNSYSRVTDSIIMDNVNIGRYAELQRCIIDKNVTIPEGMKIGFDEEKDRNLFKVSPSGVVVVPKDMDLGPTY